MFRKLPIVLNAEQLIDRSFRKSKKVQITDRNALYKKKKTIIARTDSFSSYVLDVDSGLAESSPDVLLPDGETGDKRWILHRTSIGFGIYSH